VKPPVECNACGAAATAVRGSYAFTECGLKNVILQGVEIIQCPECGDEQVIIPHMDDLMRALALAVISQPYRLQGEDVRFLRKYLKMTQVEFASYLEIDKTNLSKWENNEDRIGEQSDRLIRSIVLALGEGLKGRMEEVVRGFPRIHKSKRRPRLECDTGSLSVSYA
jgi:putative zinc finger/helix-turn-helix YgiT family protein